MASTSDGEEFAYGIAELYTAAEIKIVGQISAAAAKGIQFEDFQEYQKAQLGALQKMRAEVLKTLSSTHSKVATGMAVRIGNAYKSGGVQALRELGKTTPGRIPPALAAVTSNLVAETLGKLSATTPTVLRKADDVYRAVTARQVALYSAGAGNTKIATQQAIGQLLGSGVTGFTDSAGREWNLTDYATMAVRTATGQAAINGHVDYARSLDVELMIIRPGPRCCDVCWPWVNTPLKMDGSGSGTVEVNSEVELTTIKIAVKGSIQDARDAGWGHPNDRCNISTFIPGATEYEVTQPPHDEVGYKAQQRQRALERGIRGAKFKAAGAVTPEALAAAKTQVRAAQEAMRAHMDEHPYLKRQPGREGLGGIRGPLTTQKPIDPDLPKPPPAPDAPKKPPTPPAPVAPDVKITPPDPPAPAVEVEYVQAVKNSNSAGKYLVNGQLVAEAYKDKKNAPDPKGAPWLAHHLATDEKSWHADVVSAKDAAAAMAKANPVPPAGAKVPVKPPAKAPAAKPPAAPPVVTATPPKPAQTAPKAEGYAPQAKFGLSMHQKIAVSQGVGSVDHVRATAKWALNNSGTQYEPERQDLAVLKPRLDKILKEQGPKSTAYQNAYAEYIEQQWIAKAASLKKALKSAEDAGGLDYTGSPYAKGIVSEQDGVQYSIKSGFSPMSQVLFEQNAWYLSQLSAAEKAAVDSGKPHPKPASYAPGKGLGGAPAPQAAPAVPVASPPAPKPASTTPAAGSPGWAQPTPSGPVHPGQLKYTMPDGEVVNSLSSYTKGFAEKYEGKGLAEYDAFFNKAKADYLAALNATKPPAPNPPAAVMRETRKDAFAEFTGSVPAPDPEAVRFSYRGNKDGRVQYDTWAAANLETTRGKSGITTGAKRYTKFGDGAVNSLLRTGKTHDAEMAKQVLDSLDKAMSDPKFKTQKEFYVVRGVRDANATFGSVTDIQNSVGKVFTDKGFMSTAMGEKGFEGDVQLHIRVPPGTRGAYLDDNTFFKGESEFLLDRGSSLVVESAQYDERTKQWKIEATVVQPAVRPPAPSTA